MRRFLTDEWLIDRESDDRLIGHRIKTRIFSQTTKFQKVAIYETHRFGRLLVLDDKIQSAQSDEYIYHECLVHPAMLLHNRPSSVLVLGGGEGATLREVLRHRPVQAVTMVDIDEELVKICAEYLTPWHNGAFQDPRVNLVFTEASQFIAKTDRKFDAVILDINDPLSDGPAAFIYTREFFAGVKKLLRPGGVFAAQAVEVFTDDSDLHSVLHKTMAEIFTHVASYCEYIPSFSSLWGFLLASDTQDVNELTPEAIDRRLRENLVSELKYYSGECHQRLFSLPKRVRELIRRQTQSSTQDCPLRVYPG